MKLPSLIKTNSFFDNERELYNWSKNYNIIKKIGDGSFGEVYKAKKDGELYAIKVIDKSNIGEKFIHQIKNEMEWTDIIHPNCIKTYEGWDDGKKIVIIQELCNSSSIYEKIINNSNSYLDELEVQYLFGQILSGVYYLHSKSIIHRDLKPENILININEKKEEIIKIIDFGFAKRGVSEWTKRKSQCGTMEYVAPEIFNKKEYTKTVDMWSLGVLLYVMLCGKFPFSGDSKLEQMHSTMIGNYKTDFYPWNKISFSAKNLIALLLQTDESKRPNIKEVVKHPWIKYFVRNIPEINDCNIHSSLIKKDIESLIEDNIKSNQNKVSQRIYTNKNTPRKNKFNVKFDIDNLPEPNINEKKYTPTPYKAPTPDSPNSPGNIEGLWKEDKIELEKIIKKEKKKKSIRYNKLIEENKINKILEEFDKDIKIINKQDEKNKKHRKLTKIIKRPELPQPNKPSFRKQLYLNKNK